MMAITKKTLKMEIDNIPEQYLTVVYQIIRAFSTSRDLAPPSQPFSDDLPTAEQVVARIQSLPKDSANIELAKEPLIEGLNRSTTIHDPSFDVQEWNGNNSNIAWTIIEVIDLMRSRRQNFEQHCGK